MAHGSDLMRQLDVWGSHYTIACWWFLRCLSGVYLIAFFSLWRQIRGLVGNRGILPLRAFLHSWSGLPAWERWRRLPSLLWLYPTDRALDLTCLSGVLLSGLACLGLGQGLALALLWFLYLSLMTAGQEFLAFQWDVLLLEVGFLSIFLAPWGTAPPSLVILALLWWLLFRLMFESGVVKLTCGDVTWRQYAALDYHYFTQPLPTRLAWYAHRLPKWFQRASVFLMFVIEIPLPFLIAVPGSCAIAAAFGIAALQCLIFATGNYGFFNLLSLTLCLLLLPNSALVRLGLGPIPIETGHISPFSLIFQIVLTAFVLVLSVPQVLRAIFPSLPYSRRLRKLDRALRPFHFVNPYGLFRVMTLERPEIVVEGSQDGREWREYGFRYKPGDPKRAPRQVAPHQPRLDWQMWFAALGSFHQSEWFQGFVVQLLEGSPDVLRLLAHNPFPEGPPRYLRTTRYQYRFTSWSELRATGTWWHRERIGPYSPVLER